MGEHNDALRAARERTPSRRMPGVPMTRAELADAVNAHLWDRTGRRYELDDHLVGKWERGAVRTPSAAYRAALRVVRRVDTDRDLGFDTAPGHRPVSPRAPQAWSRELLLHDALTGAEGDMPISRRTALATAALGGAGLLGPLAGWLEPLAGGTTATRRGAFAADEVAAVEALVDAFRGWRGAGLGRAAVAGQVADLAERLQTAPPDPLTDRVFVATAQLSRIAGSMAFDGGAHRAAQGHYVTAARLAKAGGDVAFGAIALAALARLQFDLAAPDDGLAVVHLAERGARSHATPRLSAMLAVREAWGHAQRGDAHRFRAAADAAQDAHATSRADTEPAALAGFDAAELHGTLGARLRDLAGHHPQHAPAAVAHIEQALRLRDPARARNRAFDLVSLGRVHLITRDAEQAAATVRAALGQVDPRRPGRLGRKVADWHREAAQLAGCAAVADARAAITDQLAAIGRG